MAPRLWNRLRLSKIGYNLVESNVDHAAITVQLAFWY
jgi:hypothetical protein